MKKKIALLAGCILCFAIFLSGCANSGDNVKAEVSVGSKTIATAEENISEKLMEISLDNGTKLFKTVTVDESKGLFYRSYTFRAATNVTECTDKYTVSVTMPGKVAQKKDGTVVDNTVTFDIENSGQENEIAAYSEANNYAPVIVMVVILLAVLSAFLYFTKKRA